MDENAQEALSHIRGLRKARREGFWVSQCRAQTPQGGLPLDSRRAVYIIIGPDGGEGPVQPYQELIWEIPVQCTI